MKITTEKTAYNIGLLPWLCAASRRFKISYAARPRTFTKFEVRHGSKPWSLAAIMTPPVSYFTLVLFILGYHETAIKTAHEYKSQDYLITGFYYLSNNSNKYERQLIGTNKKYYLNPVPIITVDNFTKVSVLKSKGNYYIRIDMDAAGGQKFSEGTRKTIGDSLAIIINNELVHVAGVYAQIMAPVTAITREGLTKSQADKYAKDIRAKMKK